MHLRFMSFFIYSLYLNVKKKEKHRTKILITLSLENIVDFYFFLVYLSPLLKYFTTVTYFFHNLKKE